MLDIFYSQLNSIKTDDLANSLISFGLNVFEVMSILIGFYFEDFLFLANHNITFLRKIIQFLSLTK
jgi:hypothetical protein